MNSKNMKIMVAALAMVFLYLRACGTKEPGKDAENTVNAQGKNSDKTASIVVKDADGNKYPTVKIGNQVWMAKNLNVNVPGSMCYDNKPENCEKYGRLYTLDAAMKACPSGWHLPSWYEMRIFEESVQLRMEQIVTQKKLNAEPLSEVEKEWDKDRIISMRQVNSLGLSALPAGIYNSGLKMFDALGRYTRFWSWYSTETSIKAYSLGLNGDGGAYAGIGGGKDYGYSVRCLQD